MTVKLVSISKPLIEGLDNAADLIGYVARVSNPPNQKNVESMGKLLKYCLKHKHFSIFEMADATFEIRTSRDIGRQILRHKSFSFQEFSGRYAKAMPDPIIREARTQDPKNRQSSITCDPDSWLARDFKANQHNIWEYCYGIYEDMLEAGVAKEQARAILPEGLNPSCMYMKGSIRSWIHYCMVRCGNETQYEHQLIAKQIARDLIKEFPILEDVFTPLLENDYSAEGFSE